MIEYSKCGIPTCFRTSITSHLPFHPVGLGMADETMGGWASHDGVGGLLHLIPSLSIKKQLFVVPSYGSLVIFKADSDPSC